MYEFKLNGLLVTKEEFFEAINNSTIFANEVGEMLSEVFETGSVSIMDTGVIASIEEVRP